MTTKVKTLYNEKKGKTMHSFDTAPERRNTNSIKWNKEALRNLCSNEDALPFWVADMDFYSPDEVIEKAKEISGNGVYGYPAFNDLESIFSSWLKRKHNWSVEKDDISYSMGLLHGIALTIDVFTEEGDRIIVPSPTYRPFRELCSLSNRVMDEVELDYSDNRFSLDVGKIEEKLKDGASMILFCSPHNPSGIVFSEEQLIEVLKIAKEYDAVVISDEIHADLVHPGKVHIPMGKADEKVGAKVVTFMAPSKTFNLAGEHSAFAVFSDKSMMEKWKRKQTSLFLTTPGYFIGEMTRTCYTKADDYNKILCKYLKENSDYIEEFFNHYDIGIKKVKGDSSFVTFLDCSEVYCSIEKEVLSNPELYTPGDDGGILSHFFGVKASVAMNDGTWFGKQYYNFVRFNYGTNRKEVEKALMRIKKAIEEL